MHLCGKAWPRTVSLQTYNLKIKGFGDRTWVIHLQRRAHYSSLVSLMVYKARHRQAKIFIHPKKNTGMMPGMVVRRRRRRRRRRRGRRVVVLVVVVVVVMVVVVVVVAVVLVVLVVVVIVVIVSPEPRLA